MPMRFLRSLSSAIFAALLCTILLGVASGTERRSLYELPRVRSISAITDLKGLTSLSGKEFEVLQFGKSDAPWRFYIQGGLHGNEAVTSHFVSWLARRYARGQSMLNLLPKDQVAIDFLPIANPDGASLDIRTNQRGVNLNRNFDVLWGMTREEPGVESFSEPETRAIQALFKARRYTAAVDVHGYVNWIVAPSSPAQVNSKLAQSSSISPRQVEIYQHWLDAIQNHLPVLPEYHLKTAGGLGDGGAFEDWAFWSEGTMAYCLELASLQRFLFYMRPALEGSPLPPRQHSIDLYVRYETFVYRMFAAAIKIESGGQSLPVRAR